LHRTLTIAAGLSDHICYHGLSVHRYHIVKTIACLITGTLPNRRFLFKCARWSIIPLTDRIRPLIDGHFAIHDTIGMTPRTIQRILKRLANKARINRPVTPHVLRHTFAVAAVQKGISLPALQRLLGHDRLTTTEIYLNLSPEDVIREFREKW
jgi:integrase